MDEIESIVRQRPYVAILVIGPEKGQRQRMLARITSKLETMGFRPLREVRGSELKSVHPFTNEIRDSPYNGTYVGVYLCERMVVPIRDELLSTADLVFLLNSPPITHSRKIAAYHKIIEPRGLRLGAEDFCNLMDRIGSGSFLLIRQTSYRLHNYRRAEDILSSFFRLCLLKIRRRQLSKEYRHRIPGGYLDEISYSLRGDPISCSPPGWRYEEGFRSFEEGCRKELTSSLA